MKMVWKINDYTSPPPKGGYIKITNESDGAVCDIFPFAGNGGVGLEQARENARKIVNAGQLFDALKGLLDWINEGCPDGGHYAVMEAEDVIKSIRLAEPTAS